MQQIIETERLILKAITPEYCTNLFTNCTKEDIKCALGLDTDEAVEKELANFSKGLASYSMTFLYFTINLKTDPDKVIGSCGYYRVYPQHDRSEVGYVLYSDEVKRKGIASEAMVAILDYGFSVMKLHRIEAMVGVGNIPSLKIMDKFGFTQEGHLKEHYLKDGVYEDSLVFGLVRNDYI